MPSVGIDASRRSIPTCALRSGCCRENCKEATLGAPVGGASTESLQDVRYPWLILGKDPSFPGTKVPKDFDGGSSEGPQMQRSKTFGREKVQRSETFRSV